ncbi:transcription initiation factor TFIID subunit 6 [Drosophila takahashii]|uniref:transcription initiation factor TFIID subunit 6 n=1 Tax=Drosophila takahashii TaxID=29030 RepID=UPI001CF8CF53|nr:transcription initiation factor TFIID subunit 6 [Drosophila takahashii]
MWQFENKKTTEMKASDKDEGFRKKSLSPRSLAAISLHSTGQQLEDEVCHWLSLNLREDISNLLNEAGKYMRRIRERRLRLSHIQQAARMDDDLRLDIFFRLVVRGDCPRPLVEEEPGVGVGGAPFADSAPVPTGFSQVSEPEIPIEPAPCHSGWLKAEQVLLKPCKRYPLTREQQSFYELITEACVGPSESRRQRALQTLSTDPSLEVLLPTLSAFISDAVVVNVAQQNMPLLLYLLRMVRAVLANPRLSLLQYLHLILPAVLSCLLTKQACSSSDLADQWALREYSGNIIVHIVRHFNAADSSILPRVIGIYKNALLMQPLTTVFGAVIGLGKMGHHAVRACIVPQIAYLSKRIEPHLTLTAGNGISSSTSSLDRQAAKYIRHRLMKLCTPVLKIIRQAPDLLEQYVVDYGFLGPPLCDAVIVTRIKKEINAEAKKEAGEAKRMCPGQLAADRPNKCKVEGAGCGGSKFPMPIKQLPTNGVYRTNCVPQSGSQMLPMKGQTVKIPPRISCYPKVQGQKPIIVTKASDFGAGKSAQAQVPQFRNVLDAPAPMRSFLPSSNGMLLKLKNGFVPIQCNNGKKPINHLLK